MVRTVMQTAPLVACPCCRWTAWVAWSVQPVGWLKQGLCQVPSNWWLSLSPAVGGTADGVSVAAGAEFGAVVGPPAVGEPRLDLASAVDELAVVGDGELALAVLAGFVPFGSLHAVSCGVHRRSNTTSDFGN